MKKILAFSFSQIELVPNGGFEENENDPLCGNCNYHGACFIPRHIGDFSEFALGWEDTPALFSVDENHADLFDFRWQCCSESGSCAENEKAGLPVNYLTNINEDFAQENRLPTSNRYAHLESRGHLGRNDGIAVKLRHKLVRGRNYKLTFYAANKTRGAGSIPDAEMKIKLGSENNFSQGEDKQKVKISGVSGPDDPWNKVTIDFTVNECDFDYLMIKMQRPALGERHVFIDDISIFDAQFDQCLVDMDGEILSNVHVSGAHSADQPFTIYGLETVNSFNLHIETAIGQLVKKDLLLVDPFNVYSWDGRDDQGIEFPNGICNYKLEVVNGGGCKTIIGSFTKVDNYITTLPSKPNPDPIKKVVRVSDMPLTFSGLETVLTFDLKIGYPVVKRHLVITNPADAVAWDGKDDNGNDITIHSGWPYTLTLSNKCNSYALPGTWVSSATILYPSASPYYDYASYPKPNKNFLTPAYYPCACIDNCDGYNRPPLPCCPTKPDMHIQNTLIDLTKTYKASNSITVGPGVTILSSSNVTFIANDVIILNPGCTIEYGASPVVLEIKACGMKYEDPDFISQDNGSSVLNKYIPEKEQENNILIIPNPSTGIFSVTSRFPLQSIEVRDMLGNLVYIKAVNNIPKGLEIDISSQSSGIYFLTAQGVDKSYTNKVIIR